MRCDRGSKRQVIGNGCVEGRRRSMKLIIFCTTAREACDICCPWPWHDHPLSHVIFPPTNILLRPSLDDRLSHLESLHPCLLLTSIMTSILLLVDVTRLVGANLARGIPCNRCSTAECWCCEVPLSMQALAANASGSCLLSPFT